MSDTKQIEWACKPGEKSSVPDLTCGYKRGAACWDADPASGYICTRRMGHTGRHAAGTNHDIVAVWS